MPLVVDPEELGVRDGISPMKNGLLPMKRSHFSAQAERVAFVTDDGVQIVP